MTPIALILHHDEHMINYVISNIGPLPQLFTHIDYTHFCISPKALYSTSARVLSRDFPYWHNRIATSMPDKVRT